MSFPNFNSNGDLPLAVHKGTLQEVIQHFGTGTTKRQQIAQRLARIFKIVVDTNKVARFIIFGSFITNKPGPNDVDVFLIMDDGFDVSILTGEAQILFDHRSCQSYFGASIFWIRRLAAIGGEQAAIEDWQIKRDGTKRGIV